MLTARLTATVDQRRGYRLGQSQDSVGLAKHHHTAIGGHRPTVETRLDTTAFRGWKVEGGLGTVCHGQAPVRIQCKQLNIIELIGACPLYLCNIQASARARWPDKPSSSAISSKP